MYGPTTVTTKGQVTLPQELRVALSVQTGDMALFENINSEKKTATVKIVPIKNIVDDLAGSMKTNIKFISHKHEMEMAEKALAKTYKVHGK